MHNNTSDSSSSPVDDKFKEAHRRALIYWVNSFNNPQCLLASSSIDFKDGIIFCELLGILLHHSLEGVNRESPATAESSMQNISIATEGLKRCGLSPRPELTAGSVYNSEDSMFELLDLIKKLFEGGKQSPERNPRIEVKKPQEPEPVPEERPDIVGDTLTPAAAVEIVHSPAFLPARSAPAASMLCSAKRRTQEPPRTSKPTPTRPLAQTQQQQKQRANKFATEADMELAFKQGILLHDRKADYLSFPMSTEPLSELNANSEQLLVQSPTHGVASAKTSIVPQNAAAMSDNSISRNRSQVCPVGSHSEAPLPGGMQTARLTSRRSFADGNSRQRRSSSKKPPTKSRENVPPKESEEYVPERRQNVPEGEKITIAKVDIRTRQRVLEWLEEIQLIKEGSVNVADFPNYCRNGVLIGDLIVRLEGKETKLRGIVRSPKTATEILSNIKKCLSHLRGFEKVNSRYMWAERYIIRGDENVIWGLLDDMWYFYHHKTPPTATKPPTPGKSRLFSASKRSISAYPTPIDPTSPGVERGQRVLIVPEDQAAPSGSLRMVHSPPRSRPANRDHFSSLNARRQTQQSSVLSSPGMNSRAPPPTRSHFAQSPKTGFQFPLVTEEQERLTRSWLKALNLTVLPSQEGAELLRNPYRNGYLLCQLVETLEPGTKVAGKTAAPGTVFQAQQNISRALGLLQSKRSQEVPHYYLSNDCIQNVLRGSREAVWGLLNGIRELYPNTEMRRQPAYLHLVNITNLPYSLESLHQLEVSLLHWLKSLGLLPTGASPVTILEVENGIRNGTILCELAQRLSRRTIRGVFKDPKTNSTAISNLRKAFEAFRALPKINHKYLWCEKEVFAGDRGVIFGLLEELHKYYDGSTDAEAAMSILLSAKKPVPYLGREDTDSSLAGIAGGYTYQLQPQPTISSMSAGGAFPAHRGGTADHIAVTENSTLDFQGENPSIAPERVPLVREHTLGSTFGSGSVEGEKMNTTSVMMMKAGGLPPRGGTANSVMMGGTVSLAKQDSIRDASKLPPRPSSQKRLFRFDRIADISPKPFPMSTKGKRDSRISQNSIEATFERTRGMEESSFSLQKREKQLLIEWLENLGVKLPPHFNIDAPTLEEFKDGVLLCQIVGILEMHKIAGVEPKPASSASALHNIRKALTTLQKKKSIPLQYIYAAEDIYNGNPEAILGLLKCIKNSYKNFNEHLEMHKNTIQIRSKVLGQTSKELSLKNTKAPFGTLDAVGLDNTESMNTSLSKAERKRFLLSPDKAWN